MTAALNSPAASATSAQPPWRSMRMRSGSATPNPDVAALTGMNAAIQGRARRRCGQVRTASVILRLGAKPAGP